MLQGPRHQTYEQKPGWPRSAQEQKRRFLETVNSASSGIALVLDERSAIIRADALEWLRQLPSNQIHAVVTDPPYGLVEYDPLNQEKLRKGRGGVWRIPPKLDGVQRAPLPRFTVISPEEISQLSCFFQAVAAELLRVLVPGGHVFVASNPLLSTFTFLSFQSAGFEKRGEVIRLVQTLRGGDRPKGAHEEFAEVTVMPRSCWEPWGLFRKPLEGTVANNLRKWGTGALRRLSATEPFKDVIACSPTRRTERDLAPHPSLKPQRFLRQIVRAALPFGEGIVLDPFAGSGSTLAAASALGCFSIGIERDPEYFKMSSTAFDKLKSLRVGHSE